MAINGINKLLPFGSITATQGISRKGGSEIPTPAQASTGSASTSQNQNYVGVNSNIGVGDSSYTQAQAGKKAGIGKTLAFA